MLAPRNKATNLDDGRYLHFKPIVASTSFGVWMSQQYRQSASYKSGMFTLVPCSTDTDKSFQQRTSADCRRNKQRRFLKTFVNHAN